MNTNRNHAIGKKAATSTTKAVNKAPSRDRLYIARSYALNMKFSLPESLFRSLPLYAQTPFIPWGIERIQAPAAWKYSKGEKVHIAVIDTGLDFSHKDLARAAGRGYNVLEPHRPPYDDNGHGTHIAGTIAARNRTSGMTGVAPAAVIHPVKAFDYNGSAHISDIITAIDWCIQNRMHIINMSFGMRRSSKMLHDAIRKAHRAGIVIIASAGNDGKERSDYPARYPEVISVGATTRKRSKLAMSNRGKHIDIYAPGEKVMSTWLNGKYNILSGTSMAAAYVSGAAALLLSLNPRLSPRKVKLLLQKNKTPATRTRQRVRTSELNIWNAVRRIKGKRHMRSGADTPTRRRTLRSTTRTQPTKARRA